MWAVCAPLCACVPGYACVRLYVSLCFRMCLLVSVCTWVHLNACTACWSVRACVPACPCVDRVRGCYLLVCSCVYFERRRHAFVAVVCKPQVTVVSSVDGSSFSKRSSDLVIVDDPAVIAQVTSATLASPSRTSVLVCVCLSGKGGVRRHRRGHATRSAYYPFSPEASLHCRTSMAPRPPITIVSCTAEFPVK